MSEKRAFDDAMEDLSSEQLYSASQYLKWLRHGGAPDWWADCVAQYGAFGEFGIYDALVMLRMELKLSLGLLAIARIDIKESPFADRLRRKNESVLRDALPGFQVSVGGYDEDGLVFWGDSRPDFVDLMPLRNPWVADCATLEIGTTGVHKTVLHLSRCSLARWPYNSRHLWIFENRDPHHTFRECPEWKDLLVRRTMVPLPEPAIRLIGKHFDCGLDLDPVRPTFDGEPIGE